MPQFKVGDVITTCGPFVSVLLDDQRSVRCDYCFKERESLLVCEDCSSVYYCGLDCQTQDWLDAHKEECPILAASLALDSDEDFASDYEKRLWIRTLIITKTKGLKKKKFRCHDGSRRSFASLLGHEDHWRKNISVVDEIRDFYDRFSNASFDGKPNWSFEELFSIVCKLSINSFGVIEEHSRDIGHGLFMEASVFDHSCQPNAAVVCNGRNLEVRAIKDILDGEPVLICYVDALLDKSSRQSHLKSIYNFDCNCLRCASDEDEVELLTVCEFDETMDLPRDLNQVFETYSQNFPILTKVLGDVHPGVSLSLLRLCYAAGQFECLDEDKSRLRNLVTRCHANLLKTHGSNHKLLKHLRTQFAIKFPEIFK